MGEVMIDAAAWAIPVGIAIAVIAVAVAVVAIVIRVVRRSPAARRAADRARQDAGAAVVRLDDAVGELDLEMGLSGALHGADAPPALRRARMTAQHARDEAFERYRALAGTVVPGERRRRAARLASDATAATDAVSRARTDHAAWAGTHVAVIDQIAAARARLADAQSTMGDPAALVRDLSASFDPGEWQDAADAAAAADEAATEARRHLDAAASDGSVGALPEIVAAERALRRALSDDRVLEETHRAVLQARDALPGEVEAVRVALRQVLALRGQVPQTTADRITELVREAEESLRSIERDGARHPTAAIDGIARLRDRLDVAVGAVRTAQQRVRSARTALPGTLAAARVAIAHAEIAVAHARTGVDARVLLADAQRGLAASRTSTDPVSALESARRSIASADAARAAADRGPSL